VSSGHTSGCHTSGAPPRGLAGGRSRSEREKPGAMGAARPPLPPSLSPWGWRLGCKGVGNSGLRVWDSGLRARGQGFENLHFALRNRLWGFDLEVQRSGFRV
jgi:hypothetical protein